MSHPRNLYVTNKPTNGTCLIREMFIQRSCSVVRPYGRGSPNSRKPFSGVVERFPCDLFPRRTAFGGGWCNGLWQGVLPVLERVPLKCPRRVDMALVGKKELQERDVFRLY